MGQEEAWLPKLGGQGVSFVRVRGRKSRSTKDGGASAGLELLYWKCPTLVLKLSTGGQCPPGAVAVPQSVRRFACCFVFRSLGLVLMSPSGDTLITCVLVFLSPPESKPYFLLLTLQH